MKMNLDKFPIQFISLPKSQNHPSFSLTIHNLSPFLSLCVTLISSDHNLINYTINVLEDFDFSPDGEGIFEALGELLVHSVWAPDFSESPITQYFFLDISFSILLFSLKFAIDVGKY
ncbi:hypothetical protein ACH5RR_013015 [Cinchona calisaya]|uniref:Uncharacterized protein n=1 Tax=Cinchona calisaya TaxID=153742 RepID=A0ABD3A4K1_9GENT